MRSNFAIVLEPVVSQKLSTDLRQPIAKRHSQAFDVFGFEISAVHDDVARSFDGLEYLLYPFGILNDRNEALVIGNNDSRKVFKLSVLEKRFAALRMPANAILFFTARFRLLSALFRNTLFPPIAPNFFNKSFLNKLARCVFERSNRGVNNRHLPCRDDDGIVEKTKWQSRGNTLGFCITSWRFVVVRYSLPGEQTFIGERVQFVRSAHNQNRCRRRLERGRRRRLGPRLGKN